MADGRRIRDVAINALFLDGTDAAFQHLVLKEWHKVASAFGSALAGSPVVSKMHFRKMHFRKMHFRKMHFFEKCCYAFFENFANFWRARSRLYQNEILQQNMRLTAFLKLYKICILLHRWNLKFFAKNRFEKLRISQIFWKFSQILANSINFLKKCDFGAVQRSASCRSRRELSNAYFLAKIHFDTASRTSPLKFARSSRAVGRTRARVGWRYPTGASAEIRRIFKERSE